MSIRVDITEPHALARWSAFRKTPLTLLAPKQRSEPRSTRLASSTGVVYSRVAPSAYALPCPEPSRLVHGGHMPGRRSSLVPHSAHEQQAASIPGANTPAASSSARLPGGSHQADTVPASFDLPTSLRLGIRLRQTGAEHVLLAIDGARLTRKPGAITNESNQISRKSCSLALKRATVAILCRGRNAHRTISTRYAQILSPLLTFCLMLHFHVVHPRLGAQSRFAKRFAKIESGHFRSQGVSRAALRFPFDFS